MYKLLVLLLLALTSSHAFPHPQFGGKLSTNPNGGMDLNIGAGHAIGTPNHNVAGSVFAAAGTPGGPVSTGANLGYNVNGHGLSATAVRTPGVGTAYTGSGTLNLVNTPSHRLDATAFNTRSHLDNGLKFDTRGASLNYDHRSGLGASLSGSQIPKFGMSSVDLTGRANIYKSGPLSVDAYAGVGKSFSPGFSSGPNYNAGIKSTYSFG